MTNTSSVPRGLEERELDTVRALLHDLRQPLAAILLLSGSPGAANSGALERISQQARWMSQLVETVLCDAATDDIVSTDVVDVAAATLTRAEATAPCELILKADASPALAWSRPVALGRALACLVDNAVRAAGPGGRVEVEVDVRGDAVVLLVMDDGPGLGRVEPRTSLGLTTTRAMVAACHGAVELRPRRPRGVSAEITLIRTRIPRGRP